MEPGKVSVERIARQLEALRIQEEDAKAALQSATSPATRSKLRGLITRVRLDRERLSAAIKKAGGSRTEQVGWTEVAISEGDLS
jgi:hypothetical protein